MDERPERYSDEEELVKELSEKYSDEEENYVDERPEKYSDEEEKNVVQFKRHAPAPSTLRRIGTSELGVRLPIEKKRRITWTSKKVS